ncbi:MAG: glycosyltransferase [Gammaproteobacteria bacterium]
MNILMLTNTFPPFVGGVARSVQGFVDEFRSEKHRVLVAAPMFDGASQKETDVVRYPAIKSFNGSGFSMPVPLPGRLAGALRAFQPDLVHSHHPFLLGTTALRIAASHDIPLVFTHHTLYEKYTHYVPGDSPRLKRFVADLVAGYCNLCNAVIAPSDSVAEVLRERKVVVPITVIPTGVDTRFFTAGDGAAFRATIGIPREAFVVGHVGRLAPEKNLDFLSRAVTRFLGEHRNGYFLLVGAGPSKKQIVAAFAADGLSQRLRAVGMLQNAELAAAYKAMDVFAFASHTETQGMVLVEAMAAGVPVIAVEASGVREVVCDGVNGRLLRRDSLEEFTAALRQLAGASTDQKRHIQAQAYETARQLDITHTAAKALQLYASLIEESRLRQHLNGTAWSAARRRLQGEWRIVRNFVFAATDSMRPDPVWEIGPADRGAIGVEPRCNDTSPTGSLVADNPRMRAKLMGWLWSWLLRLQCATWRTKYEGIEDLDHILGEGRRVMFSFWHGKYVPLFALLRGRSACVFTSKSNRGEVISDICRRFGYHCVQIPDNGRAYSISTMRRALVDHQNGGIAVDGPVGPYHRVKKGAIKLASELGYEVVPASVCARRRRVLKHRWDRLEIPGLFTHVGFAIGAPIQVPPDLCSEEVNRFTESLHHALESLDQRAAELAGAAEHA